jgi:hypothetical protein
MDSSRLREQVMLPVTKQHIHESSSFALDALLGSSDESLVKHLDFELSRHLRGKLLWKELDSPNTCGAAVEAISAGSRAGSDSDSHSSHYRSASES